ncbi:MAG: hypothetical protein A3C44_01370 [Gammaproteobacteria bacterium RIFCSPHIGHO2_02_FULL_39_13]|nr:MAG: hypothetical protein A3C44_01370 [Gammaproteobacteria bacterium RIFCSPHIGHO2_02_FULL_39_13]OGT49543.1 MAG: hypothetical protein A3E53_00115 [Gammaproteobacteria bacterium RIFCSPHIGHO2_12_FULL_39_24]
MKMNAQNECIVFLSGYVKTKPSMLADYSARFSLIVNRFVSCYKKVEYYRVIVNEYDALRILQFGYIGALIVIQGDLSMQDEVEIFARKVDFVDFLDPCGSEKIIQPIGTTDGVLSHALH